MTGTLQVWITQLDPMTALLVMGCTFLISGIVGWYAGALILWFIRAR
jgi:hypothetical protein